MPEYFPAEQQRERAERIAAVLPEAEGLWRLCVACGRRCGVDRLSGARTFCAPEPVDAGHVRVASSTLHFGEEPMLVGQGGSGTVFFAGCNLRCVFCQNFQISHLSQGEMLGVNELADRFLALQAMGAENINLVTPTHVIVPILAALEWAYRNGLALPVVYNTNGYETVELLKLLDGVVDVYLPDLKYMDEVAARQYSGGGNYPVTAQAAIRAMYAQTGPLVIYGEVARRGTIVRHLVLPEGLSGAYDMLLWLRDEGMLAIMLSLMCQYSPQYKAREYPALGGLLPAREYEDLVNYAVDLGFEHLLVQDPESTRAYLPDFDEEDPFHASR